MNNKQFKKEYIKMIKQNKYIVKCCDIHKAEYTEEKIKVYAHTPQQAEIKFRNRFKDYELISITPYKNRNLFLWLKQLNIY